MWDFTAAALAKFLYDAFIARVGSFQVLRTDNGPEFIKGVFAILIINSWNQRNLLSPVPPQDNGMIESSHKGIIRFMCLLLPKALVEVPEIKSILYLKARRANSSWVEVPEMKSNLFLKARRANSSWVEVPEMKSAYLRLRRSNFRWVEIP